MTLGANLPPATPGPRTEDELEELLSRPTPRVLDALARSPGDIVVLGAGGKMGPSLVRMVRRAALELGDSRGVSAVSRFTSALGDCAAERLAREGVHVHRADLSQRNDIDALPDAPNVIYMAGQKFGTSELPSLTWFTNTVMPALVAERYRDSRIVAFSTGNVYPLTRVDTSGARENTELAPVGDYAASCVGRERVLEHASRTRGTQIAIVRLNYAVDLRYGVLTDLALKVCYGSTIELGMGYLNCIWQGDASAMAIQSLVHAASPPFVVNVTGPERLSVRALALELGRLLGHEPQFAGQEAGDALLSDTRRAQSLFGPPGIPALVLTRWVADWIQSGGGTLGMPTKFERRDGAF